jgi:predicted phage baseplate assembly protein
MLGQSDGTPGQTFTLMHTPLLARDPRRDYLVVQPPGGAPEVWQEVEDFAESHPEDRHYTLDSLDGTLTLGPALLQPDGSVYRFGATPPKGSRVWFARYQHGGGVAGNLPRGALCVAKSAVPYVAHVLNRQPAIGGRDAQSLDDAKLRAPSVLRTRARAVTADDYEYLARQVAGVARAHCLAPGAQPSADPAQPRPGEVVLLVLPQVSDPEGRVTADQLALPDELRSAVLAYLDARRVLGVRLDVRAPRLSEVSVEVSLRPAERPEDVRRRAEAALYHYLNPYVGGPRGEGWPVGRELHAAELYSLLQGLPGVEYVDEVRVLLDDAEAPARLQIPSDAVLCSGGHRVRIV